MSQKKISQGRINICEGAQQAVITKHKTKISVQYYTSTRIAKMQKDTQHQKKVEFLECSFTTSGTVNWHNHFGKLIASEAIYINN